MPGADGEGDAHLHGLDVPHSSEVLFRFIGLSTFLLFVLEVADDEALAGNMASTSQFLG